MVFDRRCSSATSPDTRTALLLTELQQKKRRASPDALTPLRPIDPVLLNGVR
jgi:hypothetical protein